MNKPLPKIMTDQAAKSFIKRDLSDYLTPENFTLTSFEFAPKNKSITLRLSHSLLNAIRTKASKKGVHYQSFIRLAIEKYLKNLKKAA
ncbi:CopG family transcriptional regulator [Candidatus Nomurabacteria bacterium]|nr:CopG family transcriptional regulator [Candidatus Nomurabacteria bacterium]